MQNYTGPDGKTYGLAHLRTTNYMVSISIDSKRYLVPIVVTFSPHCYTTTRDETVLESDPWFLLSDDTGHRAFCKTRWESSADLGQNVGYLINNNLGCYEASDRKSAYLHLRNPNPKFPGNGWYVMFNFKPADDPSLVFMGIASHHHRRGFPSNVPKRTRPKPFGMVLEQWIRKRPQLVTKLTSGALPGTIPIEE